MRFHHLATSNIRGNWRRYTAFLLSSTFSVMIFFLYATLTNHPDMDTSRMRYARAVVQGVVACEIIILVFTFFFTLYSLSAFLRSRSREFGLLALFGMTAGQIRRMVLIETFVIALISNVLGISLGIVFSKLFLLALSRMLYIDSPLRFMIVWRAVELTFGLFMALFLVTAAISMLSFSSKSIVEQIREQRKPKTPPAASIWLSALAALTLGAAYYLSYTTSKAQVTLRFLPVTLLVIVGTYFLFTQASVSLVRRLRGSRGYLRGTNMLVVSQLGYKLKDNARMLFMVTMLSMVALTVSCTLYTFLQDMKGRIADSYPQTFSWTVPGEGDQFEQRVERFITAHGGKITDRMKLQGLVMQVHGRYGMLVIPESAYKALAPSEERVSLGRRELLNVYPEEYADVPFWRMPEGETIQLEAQEGKRLLAYKVVGNVARAPSALTGYSLGWLVMDDAEYQWLRHGLARDSVYTTYGLELANWRAHRQLSEDLQLELFSREHIRLSSRIDAYYSVLQLFSLTLFIGVFVCVLFFIAAGSAIYFRMFTELQDDRSMYATLRKLGVSAREMGAVIGRQLLVMFFVPFLVATAHTLVAMKALANTLSSNIWPYALTVIALFLLVQAAYYLAARRAYMHEVLRATR